jgi:hypothetical protein
MIAVDIDRCIGGYAGIERRRNTCEIAFNSDVLWIDNAI